MPAPPNRVHNPQSLPLIHFEKQMYMHGVFTEQDMASTKCRRAYNPRSIYPDEAQPHREPEWIEPVPQASGMYVQRQGGTASSNCTRRET